MSEKSKRISPTGLVLSAPEGKYRVIGVDRFSNEDWGHGVYNTEKEAVEEAMKQTKDASKYCSDPSLATVYYAYDDQGNYLGGNIYKEKSFDELMGNLIDALKFDFPKEHEKLKNKLGGKSGEKDTL